MDGPVPVIALAIASAQLVVVWWNLRGGFAHLRGGTSRFVPGPPPLPSVSVLIPARNEERHIRRCVEAVLDQGLDDLEVVVLDDRSTDATAVEVAAVAAGDDRVRLVPGVEPPPGWNGKSHACSRLAAEARGDWLVFVDADTVPEPGVIRTMIALAEVRGDAVISGLPRAAGGTAPARWLVGTCAPLFLLGLPMALLNGAANRRGAIVAGQVLCVRRRVYDAVGGHAAVHGRLVDDMSFGQVVAGAGYRCRFVDLTGAVGVEFFEDGRAAFGGVVRWCHGLCEISVPATVAAFVGSLLWHGAPWWALAWGLARAWTGVLSGTPAGSPTGTLLLLAAGLAGLVAVVAVDRRTGRSPWVSPTFPLALVVWFAAFVVALGRHLTRRPTTWRGRPIVTG